MPAVAVHAGRLTAPLRSKRLLGLASDDRLVEQMRRGNELAFEVAFERHGAAILSFCTHMLGSRDEAEDAVQHTFASAWGDLRPADERHITLKPWLFTIARNRCLSMLRSRREQHELPELATVGLSEEVERRAELRELLRDVAELPPEQREALLLSETGGLTHAEVAGVVGCEVPHVKSLVFRARSALIARRDARATPCEAIREQLANLRGPALRRNDLRLHLADCPSCRAYRDDVKRQRELLAAALPVTPGGGLELGVLAAAGIGGGGAAAAGIGGGALGLVGSSFAAKVALIGVMAGGGVTAERLLVDDRDRPLPQPPAAAQEQGDTTSPGVARARSLAPAPAATPARPPAARAGDLQAKTPRKAATQLSPGPAAGVPPGREASLERGKKLGHEKQAAREQVGPPVEPPRGERAQGRGPVERPAKPGPVRRGPAEQSRPVAPPPRPAPGPKAVPPGQEVKATTPAATPGPPTVLPNGKERPSKDP
jgi:RNA polymerase sigma factor (sigma-70 family)